MLQNRNSENGWIERLNHAAELINSEYDPEGVVSNILKALNVVLPYEKSTIYGIENGKPHLLATQYYNQCSAIDDIKDQSVSDNDIVFSVIKNKDIEIIPLADLDDKDEHKTANKFSRIVLPLNDNNDIVAVIIAEQIGHAIINDLSKETLKVFVSLATSALLKNKLHQKYNQRLSELQQNQVLLNKVVEHLEDQRNLAIIGLLYGESFHLAQSQLGLAAAIADRIASGKYDDNIDEIKRHSGNILSKITSFLKTIGKARNDSLQIPVNDVVNIHELIDHVLSSKRISVLISISRSYKATTPIVLAPERQLRQVLYVVLDNSLNAMSNGVGHLAVETWVEHNNNIGIVHVSISDTGKGMNSKNHLNLFEISTYEDSETTKKGSRIGLAWSRSFLRTFGGDIYFDMNGKSGTTVHLIIPQLFRPPYL